MAGITKAVLVFILVVFVEACATGSAIVTGTKRPPIDPSQVKLYLEGPPSYEVIGIVNASSAVEITEQAAQDRAVNELKNQAAKLGANGVLLESSGDRVTTSTQGSVSGGYGYLYSIEERTMKVSGKAIFVENTSD